MLVTRTPPAHPRGEGLCHHGLVMVNCPKPATKRWGRTSLCLVPEMAHMLRAVLCCGVRKVVEDLQEGLQGFDAGLFEADFAGCRPQACLAARAASSDIRPCVMQGGAGTL